MQPSDEREFATLIKGVYDYYRQDFSKFVLSVWVEAMKPFDIAAVRDALNRHAVDPDRGQFCPKVADVVRLIGGGTQDAALIAWSKVDKAIRSVGTYETVVFDDPIIHAVINDMAGWVAFGQLTEDELPFKAKEFENRYRGYRQRGRIEHYPAKLIGIIDSTNQSQGFQEGTPKLIGDAERAALVLKGGGEGSGLRVASDFVARKLLEHNQEAA